MFPPSRPIDSEDKRGTSVVGSHGILRVNADKRSAEAHIDLLSTRELLWRKRAALRQGLWFRALSRVERGVLDLTVKYVDCIRSSKLAKVVTAILEKLKLAAESTVDRFVRTVGVPLARNMSNIAVSWGNRSAVAWALDSGFARYLAFNFAKMQVAHGIEG